MAGLTSLATKISPLLYKGVVGEVDKATLLNLVDELSKEPILNEIELAEQIRNLAHGENVEVLLRAIKQALQSLDQTVRLVELQQILQMSMVEVWLGLLLGGYGLEQKGEFYDTRSIWITNNVHKLIKGHLEKFIRSRLKLRLM